MVILFPALAVGPLDQSPAGCIVAPHRNPQCRTVAQPPLALDQSFAKAGLTHNQAPVQVLQGAGHYLAGAGCPPVNQHDDRIGGVRSFPAGPMHLVDAGVAALGEYQGVILGDEQIQHLDRLFKIAAAIVAQVQQQPGHPLALQLLQGQFHFVGGRAGESVDQDIAGALVQHDGSQHTIYGDIVADNGKRKQFLLPCPAHLDVHRGALFPAQGLNHLGLAELVRRLAIDLHDLIARSQTNVFRWTAHHRRDDRYPVANDIELNADPLEAAHETFVDRFELILGNVGGMRIQPLQQTVEGPLENVVPFHRIHVVIVHQPDDLLEGIQFLVKIVGAAGRQRFGAGPGQNQKAAGHEPHADPQSAPLRHAKSPNRALPARPRR